MDCFAFAVVSAVGISPIHRIVSDRPQSAASGPLRNLT